MVTIGNVVVTIRRPVVTGTVVPGAESGAVTDGSAVVGVGAAVGEGTGADVAAGALLEDADAVAGGIDANAEDAAVVTATGVGSSPLPAQAVSKTKKVSRTSGRRTLLR